MNRGSQKHEREGVKAIERTFPGTRAHVEIRPGNSHKWLVVNLHETTVRVTLSSSPSIDTETLKQHLYRNVRRAFAERGVDLAQKTHNDRPITRRTHEPPLP
jgi:hypothetical protein